MLGIAAAMTLVSGVIGLYGVVLYVVGQRAQEAGIPMALQAHPLEIFRAVLRQGGELTAVGIAVGLAASVGVTRLVSRMLFDVTATDSLIFAAVVPALLGVALLACWVPARRAMRVDPVAALHHELRGRSRPGLCYGPGDLGPASANSGTKVIPVSALKIIERL